MLGPWRIVRSGVPVTVTAARLRLVLAALAVSIGRPVPVEALAERLWPDRMPARVGPTVHTYVARLRGLLGNGVIETTGEGYRLAVGPDRIDLWQFRDLLHRSASAGSADAELGLIRQALALWRGRPFGDLRSGWLDGEVVPQLDDEWYAAVERRVDLELRHAPRPGRLVPELRGLLRAAPTRESLWLRLMEALHRAGRRTEVLAAYQEARQVLTAELGVEPGEALRRLQRSALLDGATRTDPPPVAGAVRQLPPAPARFTERDELARLDGVLAAADRDGTCVVAIDGAPGIGKSALAVHWAHQVASGFPDCQLHLDLHGHGPGEPVPPSEAAGTLLRALGVPPGAVPAGLDARAALLRSTLAGRRVLMLLDDAAGADQVRPLLPGGDSLVVVTSRHRLRGLSILDGAHRVTLRRMTREQARSLLTAALGDDPAATAVTDGSASGAGAVDRLVELCDGLPLGLAIAAERARGPGGVAAVVRALLDERTRREILSDSAGDGRADLWQALSWSVRALPADAAALFHRLGRWPAAGITVAAAATLAGTPVRAAARSLEQLAAAHLVEHHRPDLYEMPNLIRWYAAAPAGSGSAVSDLLVRRHGQRACLARAAQDDPA